MTQQHSDEGGPLPEEDAALIAQSLRPLLPEPQQAARMKAQLMQRIAAQSGLQAQPTAQPALPVDTGMLETLRVDQRQWKSIARGVELCVLREDEHSRSVLIRMQPDSFLLPHFHEMSEESLILEGDALIGESIYLSAGDYHYSPAGVHHALLQSPKGCTVYVRGEKKFHPRPTLGLFKRLLRGITARPSK